MGFPLSSFLRTQWEEQSSLSSCHVQGSKLRVSPWSCTRSPCVKMTPVCQLRGQRSASRHLSPRTGAVSWARRSWRFSESSQFPQSAGSSWKSQGLVSLDSICKLILFYFNLSFKKKKNHSSDAYDVPDTLLSSLNKKYYLIYPCNGPMRQALLRAPFFL